LRAIKEAREARSIDSIEDLSSSKSEPVLCFRVQHAVGKDQELFLKRLAESGFKLPWSRVVVSSEPPTENVLPTVLFGSQQNQVVENGVLQTYPIDDLMHDVKKKRVFWELARVTFREIITP
jgi:hypothetical protein